MPASNAFVKTASWSDGKGGCTSFAPTPATSNARASAFDCELRISVFEIRIWERIMPRILGVDLPNDKPTHISLRYIYGIGPTTSLELCDKAKVDPQSQGQGADRRGNRPASPRFSTANTPSKARCAGRTSRTSPGSRTSAAIAGCAIAAVCRCAASGPAPTPAPAKARARRSPARRASRKCAANASRSCLAA